MRQALVIAALVALLNLGGTRSALAQSSELVSLRTPRGVETKFLLIRPVEPPVAAVILLAGGRGALGLQSADGMRWGGGNFLVRSRRHFAGHRLIVVVADAPADRQGGMDVYFRVSKAHVADLEAIAAHVRALAPVPVWAVGTSMGTFSAAALAMESRLVDGLVLTSTVTRANPKWEIAGSLPLGVASLALVEVRAPVLILAHADDGCRWTPAKDAPILKAALRGAPRAEVSVLTGGDPPRSDPCEAMSAHGFLGIEAEAVAKIADFIRSQR
jgi:pimeloyl-ACP methyl ester carboxylesterase